ncbi:hypothetical protein WUBG_19023, partial [Wuchereria bancrofti]
KGLGQYLRTTFTTLFEAIRKDNSTIFDCALSTEFIHQLFTSLLSTQIIEFAAVDQQSVICFLKIFEKVPLSSTGSDHLSPFDYVDLEDKNLDEIMDSLAYQNPNLLAQQIQVCDRN